MNVPYSLELAKQICEKISQGMTIAKICKTEDMPAESNVYAWLIRHPEFTTLYEDAKVKQMEVLGEQIIDLTDDCPRDADAVAKAKLQVHARQWLMGKLKPKKYGDSTTIKGDKDNPLTLNLAHALDHAIALRAAGKVIDHVPGEHTPRLSEPPPCDTDSEENQ